MGKTRKKKARENLTGREKMERKGESTPSLPSFLPFNFRVPAFSIQRARLSRSLEEASSCANFAALS